LALTIGFAGTASGVVSDVGCGEDGALCSWEVRVGPENGSADTVLGTGTYSVDTRGNISLLNPVRLTTADGASVNINSLNGNVDPFILINAGATTGAVGHAFSLTLDVPLSISGTLIADSTISYSLTAAPGATATVKSALSGRKILSGDDLDLTTPPGDPGLEALDKEIDAGETFSFFNPGVIPLTLNSAVFTNHNPALVVDPAYDTMKALVQFSLSPNSSVGMSGGISQLVPEPSTYALLAAGLAFVGFVARRRLNA
jgi:PEP-CTERM motif